MGPAGVAATVMVSTGPGSSCAVARPEPPSARDRAIAGTRNRPQNGALGVDMRHPPPKQRIPDPETSANAPAGAPRLIGKRSKIICRTLSGIVLETVDAS